MKRRNSGSADSVDLDDLEFENEDENLYPDEETDL